MIFVCSGIQERNKKVKKNTKLDIHHHYHNKTRKKIRKSNQKNEKLVFKITIVFEGTRNIKYGVRYELPIPYFLKLLFDKIKSCDSVFLL